MRSLRYVPLPLRRIAIVLLGYLAAFAVAAAVTAVYVAATNTPDRQTAQGMYAFGDSVVFLGTLGFAALPASGAALYFLRGHRWFWIALSVLSLVIAALGITSAIARYVPYGLAPGWLRTLARLAPLTALAAPPIAVACTLAGLLAPGRRPRRLLLGAAAAEAAVFAAVALPWFLTAR